MKLVERHVVSPNHAAWDEIDAVAFASKNLYNAANYLIRQAFIKEGVTLGMKALYAEVKHCDAYKGLPRKVSNDVLRQLLRDWKSFYAAQKEWGRNPSAFTGRPSLPKYKDKANGRNLVCYDIQAISRPALKQGKLKLSGLNVEFDLQHNNVKQARIVVKKTHYVIEIIYEAKPEPADLDYTLVAGVDIGLDNLAVIAANKSGFQPVVVNGRPLKSINQFYNKRKAELQSKLGGNRHKSLRIERMTDKRTRRIDHYLHTASKRIVDFLVENRIGVLVIGKNDGWKRNIGIGKRNNQNFVSVPHARFVEMLTYKCELVGINVVLTEESHTSKCSFLDLEPICHHKTYMGRRIHRGMFRSATGRLINADLNGAYNIIRKVAPSAFANGVEDVAVHPMALAIN